MHINATIIQRILHELIALHSVVCEAVSLCMPPLATVRPTPQKIISKIFHKFQTRSQEKRLWSKNTNFSGQGFDAFHVFKELFNLENMNALEFLLFHTLPKSVRAASQPYLQKTETWVVGYFQITNRRWKTTYSVKQNKSYNV
jgi:hypothetical protein